jgi:aspartate aminotransferase
MKADPSVLKEMIEAFHNRRDLVLKALNEMPGVKTNVPQGAFYVFPDISSFLVSHTMEQLFTMQTIYVYFC